MFFIDLNYSFAILLFWLGFYTVFASKNYIKKLFGLSFFQTSVLCFYISIGKVKNASPPILNSFDYNLYSNPLPHVLMLTAIVVGVTTLAMGFSLILQIDESQS